MSVLLEATRLCAGYGQGQVLFEISLAILNGQVVTLLGRNGMGKTTTVRALVGQLAKQSGVVRFAGQDVTHWESHRIARLGLGLVPEGRQIFPNLTVEEHLYAFFENRAALRNPWTPEKLFALFPALTHRRKRLGHELSGGEQQMLAIARALATNPRLLILDEASEGVAPLVRETLWACFAKLREEGLALLLIDKHMDKLLALADYHYVIEKGRIVWQGDSHAFRHERPALQHHLGV
ncbi:MAG: ABC transporter ATP-binding protein [Rhodocyclaceae bacterium]|nr:ABC transporter ATP-binding protein [Rhodocyclaceae bacterium]